MFGTQETTVDGVSYRSVWKRRIEPEVRDDVIKLWKANGLLPPGVSVADRLSELCVVAYEGQTLIGVSTVVLDMMRCVGVRAGFFRCSVSPTHRKRNVATELTVRSKVVLEAWSLINPDEAVMGLGVVVESPQLSSKSREPVWPRSGLTLVGYREEKQIRIAWFEHSTVEVAVRGRGRGVAPNTASGGEFEAETV
eukprot:CAMPEP_0183308202 /NCGR_PEP_ID=MMETSP0160_2-20130417/20413_1 /TAXON_ID=2839 ORGANISM="Odontella Sinensis, Strain Grunow 1884" /NCGR_SAMPLE_ID=MMETSP0160_2 /ASSEMBLY_ACC=CAM_ASM_000250 /LENGTH=194 /DNA_ID=CAMNT_0025471987 /DNA_START=86 /DNA_END=667 /DNA_ORIENTATION=+